MIKFGLLKVWPDRDRLIRGEHKKNRRAALMSDRAGFGTSLDREPAHAIGAPAPAAARRSYSRLKTESSTGTSLEKRGWIL